MHDLCVGVAGEVTQYLHGDALSHSIRTRARSSTGAVFVGGVSVTARRPPAFGGKQAGAPCGILPVPETGVSCPGADQR